MTTRRGASIYPLVLTPVSFKLGDKVIRYGLYRSAQEAEERLDEIMEPYDQFGGEVLRDLATAVERMGARPPWATIFLPKQYPLTGHFLSVREGFEQLALSFYEIWSSNPEEYVEVGILTVWKKQGLEELAKKCPFLGAAWGALNHLSESQSWLVFSPEPEPTWLARRAVEDRHLHGLLKSLDRMHRMAQELTGLEFGLGGEVH